MDDTNPRPRSITWDRANSCFSRLRTILLITLLYSAVLSLYTVIPTLFVKQAPYVFFLILLLFLIFIGRQFNRQQS